MTLEHARPAGPAAVVALKSLDVAKSRFVGHDPAVRRQLALCMLADTVAALGQAVDRVLVVTSSPALAVSAGAPDLEVIADPGGGLNSAFEAGARQLTNHGFGPVLAVVADLPALRPGPVREIIDLCTEPGRYFVRDHHGTGTTLLVGHERLDPSFGTDSARRHAESGAIEIDAERWPEVRIDVDSEADLALAARTVTLGPRTTAMLDGTELAAHDVATVCELADSSDQRIWRAISADGHRLTISRGVLEPMIERLAIGQRIHIQRAGMIVLSAWI